MPNTYAEKNFTDLNAQFLSYGIGERAPWDWRSNWTKTDVGVESSLALERGILNLEAKFTEKTHQAVTLRKDANLAIVGLPVFKIRSWVSKGASWHVRLICTLADNGRQVSLQLPLEGPIGSSSWETHSICLEGLFLTGEKHINRMIALEISVENPHLWYSYGLKRLMISDIMFLSSSARFRPTDADKIGNLQSEPSALLLRLPPEALPTSGWTIRWMTLEFLATSDIPFQYRVALVYPGRSILEGYLGPSFLAHRERYVDFYRLEVAGDPNKLNMEELTFFTSILDGPSLVVTKVGSESGWFTSFALRSLRIVYHLPLSAVPLMLTSDLVQRMLFLLVCFVFLLPAGTFVLAFRASPFARDWRTLGLVLFVGLLSRVALFSLTGHSYDMEVWSYCSRSFYESGAFDTRNIPLPVTYYAVLLGYAPYAMLRWLGFQDVRFLNHIVGVVESSFIKLPFILSDLVTTLLLIGLLERLGDKKAIQHASLYWLNPLTILLSGVWGMYDTLAVMFFLGGLVSLFCYEKYEVSAGLFVLSSLTKGFGILGFVPLLVVLIRNRMKKTLIRAIATGTSVLLLALLPILATGGYFAVLDFATEFMRGRAGMGSLAFASGASYMNFLGLISLRPQASYLNILLVTTVVCLTGWLTYELKEKRTLKQEVEATSRFAILSMIAVYFLFFRIYEQYYLWILPLLVLYSFINGKVAPTFLGVMLGGIVAGINVPLGLLLVGKLYYFTVPNLPADGAILAVLPSYFVAVILLSIVDLKRIRADFASVDFILLVSLGGLLSFEFVRYAYYEVFSWRNLVWAAGMLALLCMVHYDVLEKRLSTMLKQWRPD